MKMTKKHFDYSYLIGWLAGTLAFAFSDVTDKLLIQFSIAMLIYIIGRLIALAMSKL